MLMLILLLINILQVFSQELKIYTINEPPLNFIKGNKISGVATDIVREILKRTNDTSTIEAIPWSRAYNYAETEKNVILFSMGRIPQRENIFKWVGPIARKRAMLLAKSGSRIKVEKLEDAKNGRMEFLKEAKFITDSENIPVIMVTASGTEDNKKLAHKVNPNLAGYVVKPFKAEKLISIITPFLEQ